MTFTQWYSAIQCRDFKSPEAQVLIKEYPKHFAQLRAIIESQLETA